jgi:hypothetical protein
MLAMAIAYWIDAAVDDDYAPLIALLAEVNTTFAQVVSFLLQLDKIWKDFVQAWDATIGPIVSGRRGLGASAGSCRGRPATTSRGRALWALDRAVPRAGPGPPSSASGEAAAAAAGPRAGGAGSRSRRSSTPPHARIGAAMKPRA